MLFGLTFFDLFFFPYLLLSRRSRGEFFKLVNEGEKDWNDDEHKELLRGMMMTACDVSAIAKPWEVQKKVNGCPLTFLCVISNRSVTWIAGLVLPY